MNQACELGAMPSNKLVLHRVDEAVISFSWLEEGSELIWADILRNPHRQVGCQSALCKSEEWKESLGQTDLYLRWAKWAIKHSCSLSW